MTLREETSWNAYLVKRLGLQFHLSCFEFQVIRTRETLNLKPGT